MHPDDIARCETLEEISLLLVVVQQLGRTLEIQSHGYLYHHTRELNEILHAARSKLELIKSESPGMLPSDTLETQLDPQYRPRAF